MIRIYTVRGCGPCFATKRALTKAGFAFEESSLAGDPDAADRFRAAGHA